MAASSRPVFQPAPAPAPSEPAAPPASGSLAPEELFDDLSQHPAAAPLPAESVATPRPAISPSPTQRAGSARLDDSTLRRWAPLIYGLLGAGIASLLFVIISISRTPRAPARAGKGSAASAVARASTSPAEKKPAPKPEVKVAARPEGKPEEKPAAKPEGKPEEKPAAKPEGKPEEKPAAKPEEKPAANPEEKPAANPEEKPAAKPEEKPAAKPRRSSDEPLEIIAGRKVAEAIRPCGVGEGGAKSIRVAAFVQPSGKIVRSFANKKQGVSDRQLNCIRKQLQELTLEVSWSEPGFIEWSLRIFGDHVEASVAGPPELKARVQR